jgi:hypothetical protein
MKGVAWNEQLHPVPCAQIGADDDALGRAIGVQEKNFERIAEVIMVELVVAPVGRGLAKGGGRPPAAIEEPLT